jgi:hypothetical protein
VVSIVSNLLILFLGPSLLYAVIWYERFSADLMYRTLINQLLSHLCYIQALNCILSRLAFILIYSFGPFPGIACDVIFTYARYAFVATITEITIRQVIKYFYIFNWKHVVGLNDDFAAFYITFVNLGLSAILVFVFYFLGFNNEGLLFEHLMALFYHLLEILMFKIILRVQWKPLNVITDNVIIQLMLSHSKSPVLFVQISNKKIHLL